MSLGHAEGRPLVNKSARLSRGTFLCLAATRAAEAATEAERKAALMQVSGAKLPPLEAVGSAKLAAAMVLKQAALALASLEPDVRARAARAVLNLIARYQALPNEPAPPHRHANGRVGMLGKRR